MNIIIAFRLGRPLGLLFLMPNLFLSMLTPLLPSSFVSLSYFILAVDLRKCMEKHSCMSCLFSIAILNGTCFFLTVQLQTHILYSE